MPEMTHQPASLRPLGVFTFRMSSLGFAHSDAVCLVFSATNCVNYKLDAQNGRIWRVTLRVYLKGLVWCRVDGRLK